MKRRSVKTSTRRNERPRVAALCRWFDRNARALPWRRKRTGYRALVAEMMLQQTQVGRVIDRYAAFLRQFPTVRALAAADEHDLLMLWQGLGYYRRARNLHRAAKMIRADFGGKVPRTVPELMTLPGVGRYTAGAIASIVYGRAEPIVDGNVQRVLARWFAVREPIDAKATIDWTWQAATELVKQAPRPGTFNEALMELGSLVCTPSSPKCGECPVSKWCAARRCGEQGEIPVVQTRAKPQAAHHHAVIVTRDGKVLVEQRNADGMWAGLWQTPTVENEGKLDLIEVKRRLPIKVGELIACGGFDHHTSHRAIRFHVFRAKSQARRGEWRAIHELDHLPMSNAQRRVIGLVTTQSNGG